MRRAALRILFALAGPLAPAATTWAATPWRIFVTGDSRGDNNGVNTVILSEITAQVLAEQPDLLLFSGDLVTGSSTYSILVSQLTTWRTTVQPVYDAGIRVLAVRGNHENQGSVGAWNAVFTGPYAMPGNGPTGEVNVTYSLTHRNAFVAGLDEYSGHTHRVNQAWLDGQFAANTRPHVFVFGHEPAFKADHADCLDDYPANRDVFWASLAAARGRTYSCGHDHFYDHARIDDQDGDPNNDLHQLIVGTAGAPLYTFNGVYDGVNGNFIPLQQYYASAYGYVVIDIDGLQVTLTWVQRDGTGHYVDTETWSYLAVPAAVPGDVNCDGVVDFGDIDPFVLLLSDPATWQAAFPGCRMANGDVNQDGSVDFADIDPFVALLSG